MKYKLPINPSNRLVLKKQTGSALMIAVFILVIMSLLGVSLSKMLASGSDAVAWETLGSRALMAADSAGEMALFELFPPGQAINSCSAISTNINNFPTDSGLANCTANISCNEFDQISLGSRHYQITATGHCQAGAHTDNINAVRTIELEARTILP